MKKPVQILTIIFALSMLATYIVYSQVQQNRSVLSGSKSLAPASFTTNASTQQGGSNTNRAKPAMVAPGSKVMAPVVTISPAEPPITFLTSTSSHSTLVAPGSKSGGVFKFRPEQGPVKPSESSGVATNTSSSPTNSPRP